MATKKVGEEPKENNEKEKELKKQPEKKPEKEQEEQQKSEEKTGLKSWLKRHWRGVTAGIIGTGIIGGSAVLAYKKGKKTGMSYVPLPTEEEQEDYSLNPNE